MSFADDLKAEADNIIEATQEITKRTAISVFDDAIVSSPVGNSSLWAKPGSAPKGYTGGRFRSNWFLTNVNPSIEKDEPIVSEEQKKSEVEKQILADKKYFQYILTNNMDYAVPIENGHSTQAPAGVVGPAIKKGNEDFNKIRDVVYRRRGIKK